MKKCVKIEVRGGGDAGADAPAVGDVLSQIRDLVDILKAADARARRRGEAVVWRITGASMRSPLVFKIAPFASDPGTDIESRMPEVARLAAAMLGARGGRAAAPASGRIAGKARSIHARVADGLMETAVDFSAYGKAPSIRIRPATARKFLKRLEADDEADEFAEPVSGSVEGWIRKIGMDGESGRPALWLRSRLDGKMLKCTVADDGLKRLGDLRTGDVISDLRVRVKGLVKYKSLGYIEAVEIRDVYVYPKDEDLPTSEDIIAPDFTGGMESLEYLKKLRRDG